MEKESKIFIFETGIKDGVFSENKKFYPSYFTKNDIRKQFLQTKKKISEKYNFNDKKIITFVNDGLNIIIVYNT